MIDGNDITFSPASAADYETFTGWLQVGGWRQKAADRAVRQSDNTNILADFYLIDASKNVEVKRLKDTVASLINRKKRRSPSSAAVTKVSMASLVASDIPIS